MKIVMISNFDNDTVDDILVAENVVAEYAQAIADFLNKRYGGTYAKYYYTPQPDNYVLHKRVP